MGTPSVMKEYWKKLSICLLELLDTRTALEKACSENLVTNEENRSNIGLNKSKTNTNLTGPESKSTDSHVYFYFGLLMVALNVIMCYWVVNLQFKVDLLMKNSGKTKF
jgi:hypothetical protein